MWHGVWLIRPDGTGLRPISPNCGPGPTCVAGNYQEPRWSPEGQRLGLWFFSVVQGENTPGFEVRDVLSGALVSAFQAPGLSVPDWSPDGNRIVYGDNWNFGNGDLFLLDIDSYQITVLPGKGINPRWSPDGKQIAFTSQSGGLYLLDIERTNTTQLLPVSHLRTDSRQC